MVERFCKTVDHLREFRRKQSDVNLSGFGVDGLRAFILASAGNKAAGIAHRLFGSPGKVETVRQLRTYACHRVTALFAEKMGDTEKAQMYHEICDKIHRGLPEYARW